MHELHPQMLPKTGFLPLLVELHDDLPLINEIAPPLNPP